MLQEVRGVCEEGAARDSSTVFKVLQEVTGVCEEGAARDSSTVFKVL